MLDFFCDYVKKNLLSVELVIISIILLFSDTVCKTADYKA